MTEPSGINFTMAISTIGYTTLVPVVSKSKNTEPLQMQLSDLFRHVHSLFRAIRRHTHILVTRWIGLSFRCLADPRRQAGRVDHLHFVVNTVAKPRTPAIGGGGNGHFSLV